MKTSTITKILREEVPLFHDFSREQIATLVEGAHCALFTSGELVLPRGAGATHFCVVLRGEVDVSVPGENGNIHSLGRLSVGDTFNESALLSGDPVFADFTAASECSVLLIPVSLFQSIIVPHPEAARQISRTIVSRIRSLVSDPAKAAAAMRFPDDPCGSGLPRERKEKILVINCGSSSLKYCFYDTTDETRQARGTVERIGIEGTRLSQSTARGEVNLELSKSGYAEALDAMVAALTSDDRGVISSTRDVSVIAHRIVHGGEKFTEGTLITDAVLADIEQLNPLAPLHNPVNIAGIRRMRQLFPNAPQIAVFDTAFHHTLAEYAYLYGIPYSIYEKHRVRRYGFHGTSHQFIALRAAHYLNRRPNSLRLVSCHLGNGSSLCAVEHGRSVDTSMGFTPMEGLMMGTRSGDIDAGVPAFLQRTENMSNSDVEQMLNRQSGLLGLSGVSSDMREVLRAAHDGHSRSRVAVQAYCYRVRKYIGAYVAAMGGVDAIAFTGGIGQGSAEVRALSLQGLECMGIVFDTTLNREARGFDEVCDISAPESRVRVLVVPTDEELMIAREALRTIKRSCIGSALNARKQEPILVEVSAHHVHLKQEHVEALFGTGHQLTKLSDLSQPGQFACKEQLTVVGPKGRIEHVRVIGPARRYTQVEIAMTEQFKLGLHPPIRESGDIANTPGCTLESSLGSVRIDRGVICALRHIHMHPDDALRYGVRDKSTVRVRIAGDRELDFGDVLVRVDPEFRLAMHIDTDEANAADVRTGDRGYIIGIQHDA